MAQLAPRWETQRRCLTKKSSLKPYILSQGDADKSLRNDEDKVTHKLDLARVEFLKLAMRLEVPTLAQELHILVATFSFTSLARHSLRHNQ